MAPSIVQERFYTSLKAIYDSRAITLPDCAVMPLHYFFRQPTSNIHLQATHSYCKAAADSKAFTYHFRPDPGLQADRNEQAPCFSSSQFSSRLTKWRPTTSSTSSCLVALAIGIKGTVPGLALVTPPTGGAGALAVIRSMSTRQ